MKRRSPHDRWESGRVWLNYARGGEEGREEHERKQGNGLAKENDVMRCDAMCCVTKRRGTDEHERKDPLLVYVVSRTPCCLVIKRNVRMPAQKGDGSERTLQRRCQRGRRAQKDGKTRVRGAPTMGWDGMQARRGAL